MSDGFDSGDVAPLAEFASQPDTPALAALIGALLLQIGVNLANDYFDHQKGIDTEERLGPIRVTQSGLIAPARVKKVMIAFICGAVAVGLYLVYVGGWPIFIIGLAAVLSTLAYSGGPYPLASHAAGRIFDHGNYCGQQPEGHRHRPQNR